ENEHYPAAAGTGHDDSRQWAGQAQGKVPLGLNCALYKYEKDFAYAARELDNTAEAEAWDQKAEKRKQEINDTFWDEKKGMYFDRMYDRRRQPGKLDTAYPSLDTFMPLWVNIATPEQAEKITKNLPRFVSEYGLFIASQSTSMSERWVNFKTRVAFGRSPKHRRFIPAIDEIFAEKQWDYPNIWAPAEYFVVDGLLNYGKDKEAKAVIERMLRAYASFFQKHGTLPEKLDGLTGENGGTYQYGDQEGFGWTSAVCAIVAGRLSDILHKKERAYATISS
ncbi:MAG TPA: trehalase family glycosidase, partial [Candidatus Saccharimonadales bacterium]|nr:trehalase family glycosidase [Candidatus Saccharimonadales bacterium]